MSPAAEAAVEPPAPPTEGEFAIRHIVLIGDGLQKAANVIWHAVFEVSRRGSGTEVFS